MDTHTAAQLIAYSLAGISVTGILGIWIWAAWRARKDAQDAMQDQGKRKAPHEGGA